MREIDDVIKREFERLGINLVSNENLAELVILTCCHHTGLWSLCRFLFRLVIYQPTERD
ncbi:MAG: hypothetical protein NTV90_05650 [Actinobacteria bacterium]|nr:hypothetical protein [Actinomycetota bacterium]